jgi:hypothetical protein
MCGRYFILGVDFIAENSKKNAEIGFGRKNQLSP